MLVLNLGLSEVDNLNGYWVVTENLRIGILKRIQANKVFQVPVEVIIFHKPKNKNQFRLILENNSSSLIEFFHDKILNFINTCGNLTIKKHLLTTIPFVGINKKNKILETRPFESLLDLENKVGFKITKILQQVIVQELCNNLNVFYYILRT